MYKKYLTNSDFTRFIQCATAAYYGWRDYPSKNSEDAFLSFLSEENRSVGHEAQKLFAGGKFVKKSGADRASERTHKVLSSNNVTVFNDCIIEGGFLARPDTLIRKGKELHVVGVKSKLGNYFAHKAGKMLFTFYGDIRAAWKDYIYDLAYQCVIIERAYPELKVVPWLLLPDSNSAVA